jgi:hypothetical protein
MRVLILSALHPPSTQAFCHLVTSVFDPRVGATNPNANTALHNIMSSAILTELAGSICGAIMAAGNQEKVSLFSSLPPSPPPPYVLGV